MIIIFIISCIIAARSKRLVRCGFIGMGIYALLSGLAGSNYGAGGTGYAIGTSLGMSLFVIWLPVGIIAAHRALNRKKN